MNEMLITRAKLLIGSAPKMHGEGEAHTIIRQLVEEIEREPNLTLIKLLRMYGIGIASLDEMEAYTLAVARGETETGPDEPKLWFSSIEAMVEALKRTYNVEPH